jgi:hypothetical protein
VRTIYLDQNKWIQLARAAKSPDKCPEVASLLEKAVSAVQGGGLIFPLSATNIYETYKINDQQRRHDLALLQVILSGSLVFRGRYKRLEEELCRVMRDAFGLPPIASERLWFLSTVFFEAFAEHDDVRLQSTVSAQMLDLVKRHPASALFSYMANASNEERIAAVRKFSAGSEEWRQRIEARRRRDINEPLSLRRRIYSAMLVVDELELILAAARKAGTPWKTISDIGPITTRRLVRDVATYYIERELTLRLEGQTRAITENDFRDMQAFCAVFPYADVVIAENQFSNLAKQAKLDEKYETMLSSNILKLKEYL